MNQNLQNTSAQRKINTRQLAVIGMLSSISIILGLTGWGFIPIPPLKATILHIPVIIGAILEGPVVGAAIGLIFGIFSVIQAVTQPTPTSFIFMNPVISVLPRILIGITSYYAYNFIKTKRKSIRIGISAAVGTLTNTIGVLGSIYLIYLESYAKALGINVQGAKIGILTVAATNGTLEIIVSILITIAVVEAVSKIRR